jgi:GntR family transcriptional regulator
VRPDRLTRAAVVPPAYARTAIPGGPAVLTERVPGVRSVGEPVLVSEHLFPAHRTEFVVDLPQAEPSMTPSGLRIVE